MCCIYAPALNNFKKNYVSFKVLKSPLINMLILIIIHNN